MNARPCRPLKSGHFNRLSSRYDQYRTLDIEPVRYLVSKLSERAHEICDLGCGTGRYLFALIEHLAAKGGKVKRAYGVDISPNMLRIAEKCAERMGMPISWIEASAHQTGLPSASISLVTTFNAIHHLAIRETLDEVARIARPKALFAVYTRLREQEAEQLWGRWFPGYLDHSINPVRDFMLRLSQQNEGFRLIDTRDFTFYRETTLSEVRELTENRFYSTLSRYPESEFGRAYARFIANLKSNFEDPNKIRYPSSYSVFLYEVWPSAA